MPPASAKAAAHEPANAAAMPDLYAVIGNPIAQSKSPLIHARFAKAMGQDMNYGALEAPAGEFSTCVDAFRREGGRGLNVTTPFKLDAFAYATDYSDRARHAGAANAMKFEEDRVFVENFDGLGLVTDIERNLAFPIAGRRVLVLGAGRRQGRDRTSAGRQAGRAHDSEPNP